MPILRVEWTTWSGRLLLIVATSSLSSSPLRTTMGPSFRIVSTESWSEVRPGLSDGSGRVRDEDLIESPTHPGAFYCAFSASGDSHPSARGLLSVFWEKGFWFLPRLSSFLFLELRMQSKLKWISSLLGLCYYTAPFQPFAKPWSQRDSEEKARSSSRGGDHFIFGKVWAHPSYCLSRNRVYSVVLLFWYP